MVGFFLRCCLGTVWYFQSVVGELWHVSSFIMYSIVAGVYFLCAHACG